MVNYINEGIHRLVTGTQAAYQGATLFMPTYQLQKEFGKNMDKTKLYEFIGKILNNRALVTVAINRNLEQNIRGIVSYFFPKNTYTNTLNSVQKLVESVISIIIIVYPILKEEFSDIDKFDENYLWDKSIPKEFDRYTKEEIIFHTNRICEILLIVKNLLNEIDVLAPPDNTKTYNFTQFTNNKDIINVLNDALRNKININFVHKNLGYVPTPADIIDIIIGFLQHFITKDITVIYILISVITVIYKKYSANPKFKLTTNNPFSINPILFPSTTNNKIDDEEMPALIPIPDNFNAPLSNSEIRKEESVFKQGPLNEPFPKNRERTWLEFFKYKGGTRRMRKFHRQTKDKHFNHHISRHKSHTRRPKSHTRRHKSRRHKINFN